MPRSFGWSGYSEHKMFVVYDILPYFLGRARLIQTLVQALLQQSRPIPWYERREATHRSKARQRHACMHQQHQNTSTPVQSLPYRPSSNSFKCLLNLSALALSNLTESKNNSSLSSCPVLSTLKIK